jgi:hypothetical protein
VVAYGFDMGIRTFFTEHPRSVGETYAEHFKVATWFSANLIAAGAAAAIHAAVPHFHTTTASDRIRMLAQRLDDGRAPRPESAAPGDRMGQSPTGA